jgi:hypothetical protein
MKNILILSILCLLTANLKASSSPDTSNSPNYKQIYDFQIGDIFLYQTTLTDCGGTPCLITISYMKYEIMEKVVKNDSVTYVRKINDIFNDTINYIDSSTNILNKYNNDIVVGRMFNDTVFFRIRTISDLIPIKIIGGFGFTYQYNNGKYDSTKQIGFPYLEQIYGQGLGLDSEKQNYFESGSETILIGYRKGNDTTGTLTTAIKQNWNNDYLRVYPNPFNNILFVRMSPSFDYFNYDFYTVEGKLVKKIRTNNNSPIPTMDLKPGVYILKISNNQNTLIRKIVKQ